MFVHYVPRRLVPAADQPFVVQAAGNIITVLETVCLAAQRNVFRTFRDEK